MQLILSGGGDAPDSQPLDKLLVSLIPTNKQLLYIPIAWKSGDFESCYNWFQSTFAAIGFTDYIMWTHLDNKNYKDLDKFGGVYIGGGNTFSLLHDLRATGFEKILLQFIKSGRPVYGGSAGAIIFGTIIDTAAFGEDADENTVGLTDTRGFNMVGNHAIQCHYKDNQDDATIEFVKKYNTPVIALREGAGLSVTDDDITVLGLESAYLFNHDGKKEFTVGSRLPFIQ